MTTTRRAGIVLLACLAFCGTARSSESGNALTATGTVELAFTPGDDAAGLVIRAIDEARSQVLVQVFSFTHRDIADALVRAQRRGVDVQVILDAAQTDSFESAAVRALIDAGVPVFRDAEHGAAHDKVIVIDVLTAPAVVTGSFNFTYAAQSRNAENVLVLRGDLRLAQAYLAHWQEHRRHATGGVRTAPR